MPQKVIILGGGIAGLSAAHELIERRFDVEVYELLPIAGRQGAQFPVARIGNGRPERSARRARVPLLPAFLSPRDRHDEPHSRAALAATSPTTWSTRLDVSWPASAATPSTSRRASRERSTTCAWCWTTSDVFSAATWDCRTTSSRSSARRSGRS